MRRFLRVEDELEDESASLAESPVK
jgi:hypothetical protein